MSSRLHLFTSRLSADSEFCFDTIRVQHEILMKISLMFGLLRPNSLPVTYDLDAKHPSLEKLSEKKRGRGNAGKG